jgi:hypothetical protein
MKFGSLRLLGHYPNRVRLKKFAEYISKLSFNRTQSRVVTGFLTGHNTLRRHLFLLGLANSPVCRGCGVKEETSAHVLCECEAWASLRHMHLGSFFWNQGTLRIYFWGPSGASVKLRGSHDSDMGPRCIGAARSRTFNKSINQPCIKIVQYGYDIGCTILHVCLMIAKLC